MNKYIDKVKTAITPVIKNISRYSLLIIFLLFSAYSGYLVIKIGQLSRLEPSQTQLDEKLSQIKSTKVNEDAINKINELRSSDISIEALFDNGRINPFEN